MLEQAVSPETVGTTSLGGPPMQPAPLPPAVEVVPTPEPDPAEGWKARDSDGHSQRSRGSNGILVPSVDLERGTIARGHSDARAGDDRITR